MPPLGDACRGICHKYGRMTNSADYRKGKRWCSHCRAEYTDYNMCPCCGRILRRHSRAGRGKGDVPRIAPD